jgi:hypothetical protein
MESYSRILAFRESTNETSQRGKYYCRIGGEVRHGDEG